VLSLHLAFRIQAFLWCLLGLIWLGGAGFSRRTIQSESMVTRLLYAAPIVVAWMMVFAPSFLRMFPWLDTPLLPENESLAVVGVLLTALGVGFAIWARWHLGRLWSGSITLKEGHHLVRTGPYALARHPIYTGFIVALLGTVFTLDKVGVLLSLVLTTGSFIYKLKNEEKLMESQFGDEYREYRRQVRTLIPFFW
jgi:protein-S-isoprenylcysteine O-methyltransferase Ste14